MLILYQVSDNKGNRRFIISEKSADEISFILDQEGDWFSIETSVRLSDYFGAPTKIY